MKTVYKYEIPLDDEWHEIELAGPVLHVGVQHIGACTIWAETGGTARECAFKVFGTGHEIPNHAQHVGSVQDRMFVWHIYEFNRDTQ